jgi:hypothetical protein
VIIGYARVSTDGQTFDAQQSAVTAAGATQVTDRKALSRAVAALDAGDVLLVTRLGRRPQHQGPPKRLGRSRQSRCRVSIALRCVGRYHNTARAADADRAGWPCGIRTRTHPLKDRRRPEAGASSRRPARPQARPDPTSTCGSLGASHSGRSLYRNCPQLRGQSLDDQSAGGRRQQRSKVCYG